MKVLIVDDDALIRDGLKVLLEMEDGFEVAGVAANGREAFELCKEIKPDLVLMDVRMPVMDGVLSTKLIKSHFEEIKVVILTTFKDDEYIEQAVKNGAEGYILKSQSLESVVDSLAGFDHLGCVINGSVLWRERWMFSVREAGPVDLEQLIAFALAEAVDAEQALFPAASVYRGVEAGLENPALARYWVVETLDGAVVGSISIVREWSNWRAGDYWWVQSLYILPEYRGKGLLKMLLERVRREATAAGALELRLYAHEENIRALKAYRREGFVDAPYRIMIDRLSKTE